MKFITQFSELVSNALGQDVRNKGSIYEIENTDIGVSRDHYLGYKAGSYTFRRSDVGRRIKCDNISGVRWWFES